MYSLEEEIPARFVQLLQDLRNRIQLNVEQSTNINFLSAVVVETSSKRSIANAKRFLVTVKKSSKQSFADARDSVLKVNDSVCSCRTLIEIHKEKRLHPSQTSNQLGHLLLYISNGLHPKIDDLNRQVCELEYTLRHYLNWMNSDTAGFMASTIAFA